MLLTILKEQIDSIEKAIGKEIQRRLDRIAAAVMCKGAWHNLLVLGGG